MNDNDNRSDYCRCNYSIRGCYRCIHQPPTEEQISSQPAPAIVITEEPVRIAQTLRETNTPALPPPMAWRPRLAHSDILKAVDAVPPFQREAIKQSFLGRKVSWAGTLYDINRYGAEVHIALDLIGSRGLVYCRTTHDNCAGFELAPKGTEIFVTGTLSRVSIDPELTECTFSATPPIDG